PAPAEQLGGAGPADPGLRQADGGGLLRADGRARRPRGRRARQDTHREDGEVLGTEGIGTGRQLREKVVRDERAAAGVPAEGALVHLLDRRRTRGEVDAEDPAPRSVPFVHHGYRTEKCPSTTWCATRAARPARPPMRSSPGVVRTAPSPDSRSRTRATSPPRTASARRSVGSSGRTSTSRSWPRVSASAS